MTAAEWVTVILQLVQTVAITAFVVTQLYLMRQLIRRVNLKTYALISALSLVKLFRAHTVFHGPADEDPVRRLIEQIEKAIEL